MTTPAAPLLYSRAVAVDGSAVEETRTMEFVASTEDIDAHGTIVQQNWLLQRFAPSGPVLYAHDSRDLPIGTAAVRVEDGQLRATVTFSTADLNPMAEQVWRNVKAGVLRGISAGFVSRHAAWDPERKALVLDDNELVELSITPTPSNANAIAQLRSLSSAPQPREQQPPAGGPAPTEQMPIKEHTTMADQTPEPHNVLSIARALELPAGATEGDAVAAAVRLRQLEVQVQTLTGAASTAEAIGALRAMKEGSDRLKNTEQELLTVKAERDAQNFEVLLAQGVAERKLTPAERQYQVDLFERDSKDGRGAARVAELRGYLAIKAPEARFARDVRSPSASAGAGTPLVWDGKQYGELSYAKRARLANENPELFRLMKDDHEQNAG